MNKIVDIGLGNQITLEKAQLPAQLLEQIRVYLTMPNPKYEEAKKRDYPTWGLPPSLFACYEDHDYLYAYRGYMGSLVSFLKESELHYHLIDDRRKLSEINLTFLGTLRPYQERAVGDTLKKDFGVLVAPCGSGKTVMACNIMAERKQPTLIIVHTKELLNQWRDRIIQYLGIPSDEIGQIGAGKEIIRPVTVGMVQTLVKRDLDEIRTHFGQIVIDEVHHTPSTTFTEIVRTFDSQYMLGLSATPYRRDGLNKLIYLSVGNMVAEVTGVELQDAGNRIKPEIVVRETNFDFDYNEDSDYQPMISELIENFDRNDLIATDVASEYDGENFELVLSDRKAHLDFLYDLLTEKGVKAEILTADVPKKKREQIIRDFESGALRVILATGQLAGEGLDMPRLNRLFVTTPIRWKGRVIQYAGRALRVTEGKYNTRIYDYHDCNVGILSSSFRLRYRIYDRL